MKVKRSRKLFYASLFQKGVDSGKGCGATKTACWTRQLPKVLCLVWELLVSRYYETTNSRHLLSVVGSAYRG